MHVQMRHTLARVRAVVDDQTIAGPVHSFAARDFGVVREVLGAERFGLFF
jgi:hypothetical protein